MEPQGHATMHCLQPMHFSLRKSTRPVVVFLTSAAVGQTCSQYGVSHWLHTVGTNVRSSWNVITLTRESSGLKTPVFSNEQASIHALHPVHFADSSTSTFMLTPPCFDSLSKYRRYKSFLLCLSLIHISEPTRLGMI